MDIQQDYIHGDKFLKHADFVYTETAVPNADALNSKSGIIFCHTHFVPKLFGMMRGSSNRYVLITHNSDNGVTKDLFESRPASVKLWFGQNVLHRHPELIPLPIGMERPSIGQCGNVNLVLSMATAKKPVRNVAMLAVNVCTNQTERGPVVDMFGTKPWVTWIRDRVPFGTYLSILHEHLYVFSPPGNGHDCIRTWEAIYLGGVVPIVKKSPTNESFADLPLLVVEAYSDVSERLLRESYKFLSERPIIKALMPYWDDRILASRECL